MCGDWDLKIYEQTFGGALTDLGTTVIPFSYSSVFGYSIQAKIEKKLQVGPLISTLNSRFAAAARRERPDVIYLRNPLFLFKDSIIEARRWARLLVVHTFDDPFTDGRPRYWRHFNQTAELADLTLFNRPSTVHAAQERGLSRPKLFITYYNPAIHRASDVREEALHEVVFVGHFEDDGRDRIIHSLMESGINVGLYGPGWNRSRYSPVRKIAHAAIYDEAYASTLRRSSLALVFLSTLNRDQYTQRCFEIPACGTPMVCPRTPALSEWFGDGPSAFFFDDAESCVRVVRNALADSELRDTVAANAQLVLSNLKVSSLDRGRQFLDLVNECLVESA
jgi:glycosyltransferase involved in cell wall biosynthesis